MTGFSSEEQETIIRIPKKGSSFFIYTNRPEHYRLVQRKAGEAIKGLRVELDGDREISWDFSLPLTFLNSRSLGINSEKQVDRYKGMVGKSFVEMPEVRGVK